MSEMKLVRKNEVEKAFEQMSGADQFEPLIQSLRKDFESFVRGMIFSVPPQVNLAQGTLTKGDMRNVSLRIETIWTLMKSFESAIDDSRKFEQSLFEAGRKVGTTFATDLHRYLRSKNVVPADNEALLRLWTYYDSSAGMGHFALGQYDEERMKLTIELTNSFLVDSFVPHTFCKFMDGYLFGFINEVLLEHNAYLDAYTEFRPPKPLAPLGVKHEVAAANKCNFVVSIGMRSLLEAQQQTFRCTYHFEREEFQEVLRRARLALDYAVKLKLGLERDDRASFFRINNLLKKKGYSLPFEEAAAVYDLASKVVHEDYHPNKEEAKKAVETARSFVFSIVRTTLKEADKEEILSELSAQSEA
jgi:hypothetical protein